MRQEVIDRIESIMNFSDIINLRTALENITDQLLNDGFEPEDIREYIQAYVNNVLEDYRV